MQALHAKIAQKCNGCTDETPLMLYYAGIPVGVVASKYEIFLYDGKQHS